MLTWARPMAARTVQNSAHLPRLGNFPSGPLLELLRWACCSKGTYYLNGGRVTWMRGGGTGRYRAGARSRRRDTCYSPEWSNYNLRLKGTHASACKLSGFIWESSRTKSQLEKHWSLAKNERRKNIIEDSSRRVKIINLLKVRAFHHHIYRYRHLVRRSPNQVQDPCTRQQAHGNGNFSWGSVVRGWHSTSDPEQLQFLGFGRQELLYGNCCIQCRKSYSMRWPHGKIKPSLFRHTEMRWSRVRAELGLGGLPVGPLGSKIKSSVPCKIMHYHVVVSSQPRSSRRQRLISPGNQRPLLDRCHEFAAVRDGEWPWTTETETARWPAY